MLHLRLALASLVVAALTTGCADGTLPRATSPTDPSNPEAPEAPVSPPAAMFGATSAPAIVAAAAPLVGAVYVCPMHAQIVRDAPGTCPICGMTLVARSRAADSSAADHDGHADHGSMK
jgi:hypothetical protein